jgi:F-box-like
MTVMKFLKHIRSKSKVKDKDSGQSQQGYGAHFTPRYGRDATARLPPAVLQRIFIEVCPLTVDDTYDSSEESLVDYGCALCDLKDLAQCALVSKRWWNAAQDLLYETPFDRTD